MGHGTAGLFIHTIFAYNGPTNVDVSMYDMFDYSWMVDFWLIFYGKFIGKYTFHMDPMGLFPNHHSSGVIC